MMNLPYFLYMAEAEGVTEVVNTRQARLNAKYAAGAVERNYPRLCCTCRAGNQHQ